MFNCLIVDDEPLAREIIQSYCNHLSSLKVVKCCSEAFEAKLELQKQVIDILFLDINLPVLDGIAFFKTLTYQPQVIFTTAYKEYAVNAFDLSACDYLLKPFSLERFIIGVDKAVDRISKKEQNDTSNSFENREDFLFIKSNGKIMKIEYDNFLFAEAHGNYIKIVSSNSSIVANMTFANLEELLPKNTFIRVHRSFIINKAKISHIEGNIVLIEKSEIPIGSNYKEGFFRNIGV